MQSTLFAQSGFLQQSRSVARFVNDRDAAQPVYWASAAQSIPYRLPFRVGCNAVEYKGLVSCIVVLTPTRFRQKGFDSDAFRYLEQPPRGAFRSTLVVVLLVQTIGTGGLSSRAIPSHTLLLGENPARPTD